MNAKRYGARARVYAAPRHPRAETHLGTARNVAASARAYERRTRKRALRTRESICARNDTRDASSSRDARAEQCHFSSVF